MFLEYFKSPEFSLIIKSVIGTIIGVPTLIYFGLKIRTFFKTTGAHLIEACLFKLSHLCNQTLATHFSLKHYCRLRLNDESKYLSVPSSTDIKLPIDDVFVRLLLTQHGNTGGEFNNHDVLRVGNRIRVIGDPGSGKSSLVKRLFRDECRRALSDPRKARLPIIVELKNLTPPTRKGRDKNSKAHMTEVDAGEWFIDEMKRRVSSYKSFQMAECFDTYVANNGILLLLDGLDEVPGTNYEKVQSAILSGGRRLAELGSNNIVLLTMRSQFHQQVKDAYRDSFGPALFLKAFSPSDIYEFLTRWPFNAGRDAHVVRIYGELTDRPTLREMCSNPLVLSMYVAEDQASGHVVAPESRTEFYKKVTEELIIKRRIRQAGPPLAMSSLREQREKILGGIAYAHMLDFTQPANSLSLSAALQTIADVMELKTPTDDATQGNFNEEATRIFNEIAKETGLISEERPGQTFRFIHLTFCEFLAAFECVQGKTDGWKRLIAKHKQAISTPDALEGRSRLLEVIPFACGLSLREMRKSSITDVAAINDDHLLARSLLETKQYAHEVWPKFVERQRRQLMETPEAEWDEGWLRDLHLFNMVLRDAKDCAAHLPGVSTNIDLDQFFKELATNQQDSLAKLLSAYAAQDPVAAFRLAEVGNIDLPTDFPEIIIEHCDKLPFLSMALDTAGRSRENAIKWCAPIAEAALRSRLVVRQVRQAEPSPIMTKLVESIPAEKRWHREGLVNRSTYTDLLTIASSSEVLHPLFACVSIIKNAPPPGSIGALALLAANYSPLMIFIPLIWVATRANPNQLSNLDSLSLVLMSLGCLFFVLRFNPRRWGYNRLIYHQRATTLISGLVFKILTAQGISILGNNRGSSEMAKHIESSLDSLFCWFRPSLMVHAIEQIEREREDSLNAVLRLLAYRKR